MSSVQRASIRVRLADQHWDEVAKYFPFAIRPAVAVERTVDQREWSAAMVACLRADGKVVFVDGSYFVFGNSPGATPEDFALATYTCRASYPTATEVSRYLDRKQLGALYDYYVDTVQPCLVLAGAPTSDAPTKSRFVHAALDRPVWHPFDRVWGSQDPAPRIDYFEQRCPPVPTWLDLGE